MMRIARQRLRRFPSTQLAGGLVAGAILVGTGLSLAACATTPAPAGISPEVVDQVVGDRRDALWTSYFGQSGGDRPDVPIVAFTPPDRLMPRYVECMHDAGYPAVHEYGDGLSLGVEGEPDRTTYLALWVCAAQYPVHPALLGYLSGEEREYLWDYWSSRTAPCLRGLGFDVPALDDREAFVDAQGGYSLTPYSHVDASVLSWDGIDAECPPLPEDGFGPWHP